MAIATDIIESTFRKTKELYFPIRTGYWLRMGLISMFGSANEGGNYNFNSSGQDYNLPAGMTFKEAVAKFNTEALGFLSQYGYLIGIAFAVLYAISLLFAYLNSVLVFVFIEGLEQKKISIRKGFKANHSLGTSLFMFRFVLGLISMVILGLIFSPVIIAFFNNTLADFNLWLLIPIVLGLVFFAIVMGIFMFLVYDFVVPIMYLKKMTFGNAWQHFLKIASGKKLQILLYWLLRLALSIAAVAVSLVIFIPILIIIALLVLIAIGLYFGIKMIAGDVAAILIVGTIGFIVFIALIYLITVVYVPIPSFFRLYSLEMVRRLEAGKK